jgi:Family of unknown function (DUF6879)
LPLLSEDELGGLLRGFKRTAFRFETRDRYNSEVGRAPFRRYLAGEPDDYEWHRWWLDMVRRDRAEGKVWQRVRIVSVPLSDYNRYALTVARLSVAAGEDIRYLDRAAADRLGITPFDAWLLDARRLVRLDFNDTDDTFRGAEAVTDPAEVDRHNRWRELAWDHARDLGQFAAEHR